MTQSWKNYEEVAKHLLNQFAEKFDLRVVEGKQHVDGKRSGTRWEIDAKGIRKNGEGFLIVECRRYTKSRQTQEKIAGLAYRIIDSGADGGIIVSPLGLQKGASIIAGTENILAVQLDENSTTTDYIMKFLNKTMAGLSDTLHIQDEFTCEIVRKNDPQT